MAAVLRSPLFSISEDDLFALAHGRGKANLFERLGASTLEAAQAAHARLSGLRQRLDFDRPYEFSAHVLYGQGGLKQFHARLGEEVDEVIAEFLDLALDHETSDQPSLTGFVATMRASDLCLSSVAMRLYHSRAFLASSGQLRASIFLTQCACPSVMYPRLS